MRPLTGVHVFVMAHLPQTIEYPTEGGRTAFMLYYPPANAKFEAPAGERPPLIVKIHGGPTAAGMRELP